MCMHGVCMNEGKHRLASPEGNGDDASRWALRFVVGCHGAALLLLLASQIQC